MKGLRFLLLGLAICLASRVKAQIYNSDVLFYVSESAKLTNPQTYVFIIQFKDGKRWWVNKGEHRLKNVCDNLKSNSYYYEYKSEIWSEYNTMFKYNSEMSNTKWCVYSSYTPYIEGFTALNGSYSPPIEAHTSYEAFKRDFSEYMEWSEPHYHMMGDEHGERVTYKRISKEDIKKMNFTGARDFLQ